jgi:hypothetical protein
VRDSGFGKLSPNARPVKPFLKSIAPLSSATTKAWGSGQTFTSIPRSIVDRAQPLA